MLYQLLVREHYTDAVCSIHEANNKKKENKENKQTNNKVSKIQLHANAYTISITITSGKY